MIKKVIKFFVDKKEADKSVKDLNKETSKVGQTAKDVEKDFNSLGEKVSDVSKKGEKNIKSLNKSTKQTNKITRLTSKGFKILGGALKAAGIGLIVGLVVKLTEAFSKNQVIADKVSKIFETISIVFTQLTTSITSAFESVDKATGGFDAFGKVIKGLINLALTPLQLAFKQVQLGLNIAQLAWEKSIFGKGDEGKIAELQVNIVEIRDDIVDLGKEAIESGKDIVTNFGEAVDEVGQLGKAVVDNLKEVSVTAASEAADRIVDLRNEAELAESLLAGLTLKYQQQAEVQRQIRDDVRLSIDERIEANEKLGEILQKQSQEELALANKKLTLAKEELALNPENIQLQKQLQDALNGVADVQERITGQQSEQITNEAALEDERKANLQTIKEIGKTEQELAKQQLESELENQKELIKRTISNKVERDAAILKAEQAFKDNLAELEEEANQKEIERELNKQEILNEIRGGEEFPDTLEGKRDKALSELEIEQEKALAELDLLKANEEEKEQAINEFTNRRNSIEQQFNNDKIDREKAVRDLEVSLAQDALASIGDLLGESSDVSKGIAAANAIFSTYAAINTTLSDPTIPSTFARIAASIAIGVRGFANVKSILETNPENATSGGSGTNAGPSVNSQNTRARFDLSRPPEQPTDLENETTQVYVTSDEVTTQQSLDRNRKNNTRFF